MFSSDVLALSCDVLFRFATSLFSLSSFRDVNINCSSLDVDDGGGLDCPHVRPSRRQRLVVDRGNVKAGLDCWENVAHVAKRQTESRHTSEDGHLAAGAWWYRHADS